MGMQSNVYFTEPYGALDPPRRYLRVAVEQAARTARAIQGPAVVRKVDGKTLLPSIIRTVFPDGTVKIGDHS